MTDVSPLDSLRWQSMELLAYAVLDLFPNTILVKGKMTNVDFSYDFIFEKPLTDQAIPLIEEKWRGVLKSFSGFEHREMMRENAAALFQHYNQPFKADEVLEQETNTVSLIQLGHFYDLSCGFAFADLKVYPKLFSYFTYRQDEAVITRIEASVFLDQSESKKAQKLRKQREGHQVLGKDLFECSQGEWCFFPRGEALKQAIVDVVEGMCVREGFSPISFSSRMPELNSLTRFGVNGVAFWEKKEAFGDINKGLLDPSLHNALKIIPIAEGRGLLESCISSLQFIQKIIKIFDLNHEWVLRCYRARDVSKKSWQAQVDLLKSSAEQCDIHYCSDPNPDSFPPKKGDSYPRMELSVYDALGRRWSTSAIGFGFCENKETLIVNPLVSLERLIALLLEQTEGKLPNWLQPEQARILPVAKEYKEPALAIQQVLLKHKIRTGLDLSFDKLIDKIRLGYQHHVPYLLVVGDEEEKNGFVAVRRLGEEQASKMKLEDFILIAKQELKGKFES